MGGNTLTGEFRACPKCATIRKNAKHGITSWTESLELFSTRDGASYALRISRSSNTGFEFCGLRCLRQGGERNGRPPSIAPNEKKKAEATIEEKAMSILHDFGLNITRVRLPSETCSKGKGG